MDHLTDVRNLDIAWVILCTSLIFFMQAGFAMLEAGIVHPKNVTNILFKNMIDASLAAFFFWAIGYGVAYGTTATGGKGFIGSTNWGIGTSKNAIRNGGGDYMSSDGWESWMIQWAFAAKAVSIVAGSVAERTQLHAYFIYSSIFTLWIYPVVAHWVWGEGFLSPGSAVERPDWNPNGLIDFAGCGVVHMVGGYCGMVGAIVLGPRTGRFQLGGEVVELYTGNKTLQALGTFILWFGWYGFNAGSTLGLNGNLANIAGKVCVNTTMGGAMGGIAATFIYKGIFGIYDISMGLNGVLAGLVSVTANCHVIEPWHAIIIGFVGGVILIIGHFLLLKIKIDDPCDATVVHGFCGTWGLFAVGIFCIDSNIQYGGYSTINTACKDGVQFGVQVLGALIIFVWTVGMSAIMFLGIKYTVGIRVSNEVEDLGLDVSEHGALFEEDDKPTSGPTELWTAPMQQQPHSLTHALPSTMTMGIA